MGFLLLGYVSSFLSHMRSENARHPTLILNVTCAHFLHVLRVYIRLKTFTVTTSVE
jgi:hypothetical protein